MKIFLEIKLFHSRNENLAFHYEISIFISELLQTEKYEVKKFKGQTRVPETILQTFGVWTRSLGLAERKSTSYRQAVLSKQ